MFCQDDEIRVWFSAQRQCNLACQTKAGAAIWNPDQIVAEAILCKSFAIDCAGEVVRGVCMGVIDMCERKKPVQQGFDGRTWTGWLVEAMSKVVDHFRVAHSLTFQQGEHIVQKQS